MHLQNLENLYANMHGQGDTAITFHCRYNNTPGFSCIFIADENGKILYISSLGENSFTIKIQIKNDFNIEGFKLDNDIYNKLCKYLQLTYNLDNPFIPTNFLANLDKNIPNVYNKATRAQCVEAISKANNLCDEDKIYFTGWKKWHEKTTSDDNMEKTAILVGFESAKRLQNNNISSCWTADANDEDLSKINQWIDLFDE